MKNLNKVLAMLVVFMMMLSTVAFASSFTDVADTSSFSTAIEVGVDLGLIKGYTDGTFAPEGEITRAEFAAIIVRLLGQDAQADGAKASTQFVDVPADHWAAGYVNIAVQAQVINGYGDGNFGPDDLVEYQDAITMMVRALGYEPAIGSAGYPTGYLTKAGELGLTTGVNGTNGVAINRGTVAQIAFNALDVPLMTQSGYGTFTQYVINDGYSSTMGTNNVKKTLISENHSTVKVQGVITTSTDATSSSANSKDKIEVKVTDGFRNKFEIGLNSKGELLAEDGKTVSMFAGASDAMDYVGKKVVLFVEFDEFEDECTVKSLYEVKSSDNLVIDLADIDSINYEKYNTTKKEWEPATGTADAEAIGSIKYTVSGSKSKTVNIDVNSEVYYNGVLIDEVAKGYAAFNALEDGTIELALNDGGNTSADFDTVYITSYDVAVVDGVKASSSRVDMKTYTNGLRTIKYNEENGDVKATLVDENGADMDWAELEENTVLSVKYVKTDAKTIYDAKIINNVVTGTVTEYEVSGSDTYVVINDTEYKVLACAEADGKIKVGDEGTYYIGTTGIVYFDATITRLGNYAYVIAADNGAGMNDPEIKVVTKDNTIVKYDVASKIYVTKNGVRSSKITVADDDKDDKTTEFDLTTLEKELITYKLDSSNRITAIELAKTAAKDETDGKYFTVYSKDYDLTGYDPDDMAFAGGLTLTDETVIFDARNTDPAEWEVVNILNLAEDDYLKTVEIYDVDDRNETIGALVLNSKSVCSISGNASAATFVTGWSAAEDEDGYAVVYVKGYVNGEAVTYTCDDAGNSNDTVYGGKIGTLVIPKYKANGEISSLISVTDDLSTIAKAAGGKFTPDAQKASKNGSSAKIYSDLGKDEFIKVPSNANVYIYNNKSNDRYKFDIDGYVGYVDYVEAEDKIPEEWWLDETEIDESDITVYYYEFDGDIVDVVYYIAK